MKGAHGHPAGDKVRVAAAGTLSEQIRKTDFVARYGGEEFCVLFTDVDEPTALLLGENQRRAVAGIRGPLPVTASFGVRGYAPIFRNEATAFIKAADEALYRAKAAGRNRVMGPAAPVDRP